MADLLTFSPIDMTSVAGAMVNGAAGLLGMSGSSHYQRRNMREAARLQHEENLFWAEYNTPENQMARLRAAGLNPNLVYGNGADAQAQGSVSPSGGMPNADFKLGTDILMMQNMVAQNKNLEAQNQLLKAQTKKENFSAESIDLANRKAKAAVPELQGWIENKKNWQSYLDSVAGTEQKHAQTLLYDSERELNQLAYKIDNETAFQIKTEMLEGYKLQNALADLARQAYPARIEKEFNLLDWQARELSAKIGNLSALSEMYRSTTDLNKKKSIGEMIQNGISFLEYQFQEWNKDVQQNDWTAFWQKYVAPVTQSLSPALDWIPATRGMRGAKSVRGFH